MLFILSAVLNFVLYGVWTVASGVCTHLALNQTCNIARTLRKYGLLANALVFLYGAATLGVNALMDVYGVCDRECVNLALGPKSPLLIGITSSVTCDAILLWQRAERLKIVIVVLDVVVHGIVLLIPEHLASSDGLWGVGLNGLFLVSLIAFKTHLSSRYLVQYVGHQSRVAHRTVTIAAFETGVLLTAFSITVIITAADSYIKSDDTPQKNHVQETLLWIWPSIAVIITSLVVVRVSLGIVVGDWMGGTPSSRYPWRLIPLEAVERDRGAEVDEELERS